jgi:hypothetical protein
MRPFALIVLVLIACHGSPTEPLPPGRTGTLTGRVLFIESGAPALGARVVAHYMPIAHGRSTDVETVSDAGGRYSFANLLGGQYIVSAYKPGSSDRSLLTMISLGPGQNVLDLQISAGECVRITGFVTDRTRKPIAGAIVSFLNMSATTASDGSYSLALGCPPPNDGANHTWRVEHPQYQSREFPMPVPSYSTTMDVVLDAL